MIQISIQHRWYGSSTSQCFICFHLQGALPVYRCRSGGTASLCDTLNICLRQPRTWWFWEWTTVIYTQTTVSCQNMQCLITKWWLCLISVALLSVFQKCLESNWYKAQTAIKQSHWLLYHHPIVNLARKNPCDWSPSCLIRCRINWRLCTLMAKHTVHTCMGASVSSQESGIFCGKKYMYKT